MHSLEVVSHDGGGGRGERLILDGFELQGVHGYRLENTVGDEPLRLSLDLFIDRVATKEPPPQPPKRRRLQTRQKETDHDANPSEATG